MYDPVTHTITRDEKRSATLLREVTVTAPRFGNGGASNTSNFDFDLAGKIDVAGNAVIGISKEGFEITSKQVANSKYYTRAAKNTTRAVANNLKKAGYVGLVLGTAVSGYELYLNGGTTGAWVRFGVGLGISAIGVIPYVGLPAAIILGSIEAGGALDDWYDSFDK